ncbi:MAG TPA: TasA family protein [Bacillota bacterium]|nr:TasA family protein [Bacillota bacterium]
MEAVPEALPGGGLSASERVKKEEEEKMNRKIFTSLLVIGMALAAIAGGTLAWFTAEVDLDDNVFTAGTLEIEADEHWEYKDTGVENWNPGDCTDKEVLVKISGSKTAYLRMKIDDGWYEKDDEGNWNPWTPPINPIKMKVGDQEFPAGDWALIDGWYYYFGVNYPGDEITIITQVCLSGQADNSFQGKQYRVGFDFEAIQTTHEACFEQWGVGYIDYDDGTVTAKGWYPVAKAGDTWTMVVGDNSFVWSDPGAGVTNVVGWELVQG